MSVFVVDASLVIKWFVPEIQSEAARRWLGAAHDYVAPDLLFSEAANTVLKKVRRKELEPDEGRQLVLDLAQIAVETVATRSLLQDAVAFDVLGINELPDRVGLIHSFSLPLSATADCDRTVIRGLQNLLKYGGLRRYTER